jgi:LAS superfamily LD-carboxypeptidase LdcB
MMAAAEADGLTLGGGGYRSSDSQIALRRAHCGTSDYAIYEMSPSQCSPPTARPGQSMHEQGLAIDFTCNGGGALSTSSPCYSWLKANAASYGFYNLPSEAWHWSTNGN